MVTKIQLQQLLIQDQEPFHLHDYIAERRTKLRTSSSKNQLQLARITKPVSDRPTSSNRDSSVLNFPVTFCKNACFNLKKGSPELLNRASPVFNLPMSPVKLLQIPSKTAALLLEAALRIQNHSTRKRTNKFGTDFSFFGSVLKKLSIKTQKRNSIDTIKHQTTSSNATGSGKGRRYSNLSDSDMDFCSNRRRSDAVWSEDKSLDTETSCSSSNSELTRIVGEHTRSPSRCPSPDFSSRPPSPNRRPVKDVEEEDKEQCSPVCVLDPPFEDDTEDHDQDDNGYGCECSYPIVGRKKQQLLHKQSRFDALADLDPKDLEKLILEDELLDYTCMEMLQDTNEEFASDPADDILRKLDETCGFDDMCGVTIDMKRLVLDLIAEEEMKAELADYTNENDVVNTVCAKVSSWSGVKKNTIDMMVGEDFRQEESCKWKTNKEEMRIVAMDIELGIFASLVREVFM